MYDRKEEQYVNVRRKKLQVGLCAGLGFVCAKQMGVEQTWVTRTRPSVQPSSPARHATTLLVPKNSEPEGDPQKDTVYHQKGKDG